MDKNALQYSKYRMEKAKENLASAVIDLTNQQASAAVNRSYYSIFHAIRAILALDNFDSKKHSGVIAYFREKYVKTGIFTKNYSIIIGNAFDVRNNSDYVDFFETSMDDAKGLVENAKSFLNVVEAYLKERWADTPHE